MNDLLTLHFNVGGDLLEAARQCEEDVFLDAFGNTRDQLEAEYGPYNDQSIFVAVADEAGRVHGACRLITPGPAGLKTLNDLARQPWGVDGARAARAAGLDPQRTWDIGTLGVRKDARGNRMTVAIALYHALVIATRVNEVQAIIAVLDDQVRRLLTTSDYVLGTLPGTRTGEYLGSAASTPVYGFCTGMLDAQRRMNPEAYRLMSLGIGLDGIVVPESSAFELHEGPSRAVAEAAQQLPARVAA